MLDRRHRERDYPVIQAGIVVFALFVVLVNLAMDLVYISSTRASGAAMSAALEHDAAPRPPDRSRAPRR